MPWNPIGKFEWVISWSLLSGVPAFASRWPTFAEVTDKPATYAPAPHTHSTSDITGLDSQLAARAILGQDAVFHDVVANRGNGTGVIGFGTTPQGRYLYWTGSQYVFGGGGSPDHTAWHSGNFNPTTKANTSHTHAIGDVTGLQAAINARPTSGYVADWLNTPHSTAVSWVLGEGDPYRWSVPQDYTFVYAPASHNNTLGIAFATPFTAANRFYMRGRHDVGGDAPWNRWKPWVELLYDGIASSPTINGEIRTAGAVGGFSFADRGGASNWTLYSTGNIAYLWNNTAGNLYSFTTAGWFYAPQVRVGGSFAQGDPASHGCGDSRIVFASAPDR